MKGIHAQPHNTENEHLIYYRTSNVTIDFYIDENGDLCLEEVTNGN